MLSSLALVGVSALLGSYGILTLIAAYRVGNLAAWRKLAILGGLSVLVSATLANIASRLMS
jgi:branched-subunit amino acid transport protein AzlD